MQTTIQTSAPALTAESTIPLPSLAVLSPLREPSPGTVDVGGTSGSQISNVRSEIAAVPPLQTPTLALVPTNARAFQDPLTTSSSFALGTSLRTSNFELRTCSRRRARRHGAIARLPKDCRDLVNRMLSNGVVYRNIVAALKECGYTVSERNISNWYASGYKDWQDDQAEALHHARIQDALLDHFRQTDSSQLAEIGLQTAATRLSEILLQKTIDGEDIESALPLYRQMVDLLCRVNREILSCHKHREDSAVPQGPTRERDAAQLKYIETTCSQGSVAPDPDTELPPTLAPLLLAPLQPQTGPHSKISDVKSEIAPENSSSPRTSTSDTSGPSNPIPELDQLTRSSAEWYSAVSPVANRPASVQPESTDPLANPAQSSAPAPTPDPSSEIANLKCAPLAAAAVSESAGTVQKLSPPGEAAAAPDTALRHLA